MSSYQPGIPTGFVNLDTDYANIQGNFQQLDTSFAIDHTAFSVNTLTNPAGYHKNIHLTSNSTTTSNPPNNQPVSAPAAVAGFGQLFSAEINDGIGAPDTALYFLTGGNILQQLTRNFLPVAATNGYTFLPGGLIFQWGVVNAPGATGTVTFATANIAFPNNCFNVSLTMRRDSSSSTQGMYINGLPTTTSFSFNGSSPPDNLYWTALGN